MINWDNIVLYNALGAGNFGSVCRCMVNGKEYAAKTRLTDLHHCDVHCT